MDAGVVSLVVYTKALTAHTTIEHDASPALDDADLRDAIRDAIDAFWDALHHAGMAVRSTNNVAIISRRVKHDG